LIRFAVCALAALALVGCGQGEPKQGDPPVIEAPTADTSIGPNSAAGISAALPMTVDAVRAAAPHFIVAEVDDQVEGDPFKAITLSDGDEEVFRIYPTPDRAHIHAITTRSTQARGPMSEVVGQTLFGVAPMDDVAFCLSQSVDGAAGFACSTAADGRFWRVYRVPEGYDGPSDPFDAIDPDVLHDSTLVEMRWIAPRVASP
jgi:hypothetical protein